MLVSNFDVTDECVNKMPPGPDKAIQLVVSGLLTDGGHHKQWFLERIAEALGYSVDYLREKLQELDYDFDEGIAP